MPANFPAILKFFVVFVSLSRQMLGYYPQMLTNSPSMTIFPSHSKRH